MEGVGLNCAVLAFTVESVLCTDTVVVDVIVVAVVVVVAVVGVVEGLGRVRIGVEAAVVVSLRHRRSRER